MTGRPSMKWSRQPSPVDRPRVARRRRKRWRPDMAAAPRMDVQESIVKLFDKAAFASTSYPRLQTVFERMMVANLDALREIFPAPPQYVFKEIDAQPLGEVLDSINEEGIAGIFTVPEWDARILFAID